MSTERVEEIVEIEERESKSENQSKGKFFVILILSPIAGVSVRNGRSNRCFIWGYFCQTNSTNTLTT